MPSIEIRPALKATVARRPSGVALLALLGLLGLVAVLFFAGIAGNLVRQNETDQRTADALAQAKEALIGYAANYPDEHSGRVFGYLPCPDRDGGIGEGTADTACGSQDVTVIGRLPWKTLELPPLRDGDGECLWYAVSGNFKNSPSTDLMNWDTNGLITVMAPDGSNFAAGGSGSTAIPTRRAAAVIFAPGAILPGQDRSLAATNPPTTCGGNYNATNYLDNDTVNAINNATGTPAPAMNALSKFIAALNSNHTAAATNTFNDRLVFITPDEIFADRAQKRSDFLPYLTGPNTGMLRKLADCFVQYGQKNGSPLNPLDKRLPWSAPLTNNNYGNSNNYNDAADQYSGRLPYILDDSATLTVNLPLLNLLGETPPKSLDLSNFCPSWGTYDEFWTNWKDHVFYAVAKAFAPNNLVAASLPNPCAADECLTVGTATDVAAVLIFAGEKVSGQNRDNDTNPAYTSSGKSTVTNYLEAVNATAIQQNTPNMASPRLFSKTPAGGNDTVMCIRSNAVSGLYVDPTCAAISTCSADASELAGYRSGNINNCKLGTKDVLPACQTLADRIGSNNCACKKAAKDFISKKCLNGFTEPKCENAYTSLTTC